MVEEKKKFKEQGNIDKRTGWLTAEKMEIKVTGPGNKRHKRQLALPPDRSVH